MTGDAQAVSVQIPILLHPALKADNATGFFDSIQLHPGPAAGQHRCDRGPANLPDRVWRTGQIWRRLQPFRLRQPQRAQGRQPAAFGHRNRALRPCAALYRQRHRRVPDRRLVVFAAGPAFPGRAVHRLRPGRREDGTCGRRPVAALLPQPQGTVRRWHTDHRRRRALQLRFADDPGQPALSHAVRRRQTRRSRRRAAGALRFFQR